MNEDKMFCEIEKEKGLSIKLENFFSFCRGQSIPINIKIKEEKHKLTSGNGTHCVHKG